MWLWSQWSLLCVGSLTVTVPGPRTALLTPPPLIPISSQLQPVPPSYNATGKVLLEQLSESLTSPTFQAPQKKELRFHTYSGPKQLSPPAYLGQITHSNSQRQQKTYSSHKQQGTYSSAKQQRGKTSPRTYSGPKKHSTPNLRSAHTTPRQTPKQQRGQTSPQTYSGPKRVASSASHNDSSSIDYGRNYGSIETFDSNFKSFADDFPREDYPSRIDRDKSYQSSHDHNNSYRSSLDHDNSYRSSRDADHGRSYTLSLNQRQESRFDDSQSNQDYSSGSIINGGQYISPRESDSTSNITSDFLKIVAANAVLSEYTPVRSDRHFSDYYRR